MLKITFIVLASLSLGICLAKAPIHSQVNFNEETVAAYNKIKILNQEEPVISTSCGDVLKSTSGLIVYKNTELYSPNERCIWTIRVQNAKGILFSLAQTGVYDTEDGIILSSIDRNSNGISVQNIPLRDITTTPILINGSVATIMFYSDDTLQGTGFMIMFQIDSETSSGYSPNSRDFTRNFVEDGFENAVNHPVTGTYDNDELSTFIFSPPNYIYRNVRYVCGYTKLGLDEGCADEVGVLEFVPGSGWLSSERLCSNTTIFGYSSRDVPMFVFASDAAQTAKGFNITYHLESEV